ncbi:hypothetical protein BDN67DRAFT_1017462 [Paxillus ammoniavirescens]|nr:hypothetical protein BDN67DRAFT_1017462 [Paxillus ammoniavirescens]
MSALAQKQAWSTLSGSLTRPTPTLVMAVPFGYSKYLEHLLYHRFAPASILYNNPALKIKPYKAWAALAQNLQYIEKIWGKIQEEASGVPAITLTWWCSTLERYALIEVMVKRHEPVYLSKYRHKCRAGDAHLNSMPVSDATFTQEFKTRLPIFAGGREGPVIPKAAISIDVLCAMLTEALDWYGNEEHLLILDPYSQEWHAMGLESYDPFDPLAEDTPVVMEEEKKAKASTVPKPKAGPSAPPIASSSQKRE